MNEPSKPLGSTQSQQPSQAAATYVAPQSVSCRGRFDPIPACRLSTKRRCANSASANLGRRDEPSYGNGSPLNTRWHISDTGRDSVPAIEVPAKISLTCNATQSFTFSMSLLVSWLSRTLPDYLTDVLAITLSGCFDTNLTSSLDGNGEQRCRAFTMYIPELTRNPQFSRLPTPYR